jgi:hypothetical protein
MAFGAPKPPKTPKKPLNIDADQTNSNQQAVPVAYGAGRFRAPLQWIAPLYNQINKPVKTSVPKGDSQTTGYNYGGDFVGLICMGGRVPLGKIWKQIVDSEIAWRNDSGLALSSTPTPITVPKYGQTYVYPGTLTQGIDTNVLTPISPTLPGGADPRDPSTWPGADETTQHSPP